MYCGTQPGINIGYRDTDVNIIKVAESLFVNKLSVEKKILSICRCRIQYEDSKKKPVKGYTYKRQNFNIYKN